MNKRKFEEFDYPSRIGKTGLAGLKPLRAPARNIVTVTRRSLYDEEEPEQLDNYLSSFYLIKTPYGYALGRRDPEGYMSYVRRRAIRGPGKRSYQGMFVKKSSFIVFKLNIYEIVNFIVNTKGNLYSHFVGSSKRSKFSWKL